MGVLHLEGLTKLAERCELLRREALALPQTAKGGLGPSAPRILPGQGLYRIQALLELGERRWKAAAREVSDWLSTV